MLFLTRVPDRRKDEKIGGIVNPELVGISNRRLL